MINELIRRDTPIFFESNSIRGLSPEFSLCDVYVMYPGENRNGTVISKEVVEKAAYSLYGIPIVGEWVEQDDGSETWGSHGGRIVMDSSGIRFEQTTKPLGFVPKDAVEGREWVTLTEKDGHTQHEYLKLSGCVLWTGRIEETKTILEENFGQSMEVKFTKGNYNEDDLFVAEEMVFSALCVLGTATPCFESASIGRHYAYDEFKSEFKAMMFQFEKEQKEVKDMNNETKTNPVEDSIESDLLEFDDATKAIIDELNESIGAWEQKYIELEKTYAQALGTIKEFEAEKAAVAMAEHRKQADAVIESYSSKLGKCSEYLLYRRKVDYTKSIEDIQTDMTLLMGKFAESQLDKSKKLNFELTETTVPKNKNVVSSDDRYGGILEKHMSRIDSRI